MCPAKVVHGVIEVRVIILLAEQGAGDKAELIEIQVHIIPVGQAGAIGQALIVPDVKLLIVHVVGSKLQAVHIIGEVRQEIVGLSNPDQEMPNYNKNLLKREQTRAV